MYLSVEGEIGFQEDDDDAETISFVSRVLTFSLLLSQSSAGL